MHWAKTNMTRTHGQAARGQGLIRQVPHGHWTTMTLPAALRSDRIDAPCVFDDPTNGKTFLGWARHALVPTLGKGDLVVLGNLGSHKGHAVRAAVRRAGAYLIFLPPYGPDLSPTEMVFVKLRTLLGKADERSRLCQNSVP